MDNFHCVGFGLAGPCITPPRPNLWGSRLPPRPIVTDDLGFFSHRKKMPIIKIDEAEYNIEHLSDEAKAQLASIQFVDAELLRLNALVAALQTSRIAYANALNQALLEKQGLSS